MFQSQPHPLTTQLRVVVWVMVRQAGYAPLRSPVAFSGPEKKGFFWDKNKGNFSEENHGLKGSNMEVNGIYHLVI